MTDTTDPTAHAIYSAPERVVMLRRMRDASSVFYGLAVQAGCHPFIEFTGLMNEYIKCCELAHKDGIDFASCNKHAGQHLPMPSFAVDYVNEKLECIFTGRSVMQETTNTSTAAQALAAAHLPSELRLRCGHDSRSVEGCLHCEAADAIERLTSTAPQADAPSGQEAEALRAIMRTADSFKEPCGDLTKLHANGAKAWAGVSDAAAWVDELRGNVTTFKGRGQIVTPLASPPPVAESVGIVRHDGGRAIAVLHERDDLSKSLPDGAWLYASPVAAAVPEGWARALTLAGRVAEGRELNFHAVATLAQAILDAQALNASPQQGGADA